MDMLTVAFLHNYRERPLHLMGGMAVGFGALGSTAILAGLAPFTKPGLALPLEIIGGCLIAGAVPLLGLGFLGELLINTVSGLRAPLPIVEELPARSEAPPAQTVSVSGVPPAMEGRAA
jgi:hypothetical protein